MRARSCVTCWPPIGIIAVWSNCPSAKTAMPVVPPPMSSTVAPSCFSSSTSVAMPAAIGEEAIKQIKIVELIAAAIDKGNIKIVPDVLVAGGGNATDGLMAMLTKLLPGVDLPALIKRPVPTTPVVPHEPKA